MLNGYLAATRRRALAVLADGPNGCTEAIMLGHGFTAELLIDLVQEDLASVISERRGDIRFKVTEAGWQAFDEPRPAASAGQAQARLRTALGNVAAGRDHGGG